ncbi:MAG TPA: hypothetical protein DEG92_01610 [Rikenellaceae bacterium]|nr:hypothetical protein [Rikenellaceae bacterium]
MFLRQMSLKLPPPSTLRGLRRSRGISMGMKT